MNNLSELLPSPTELLELDPEDVAALLLLYLNQGTGRQIDVWIPTVDQRWLILPRYTQPSPDTKLLIEKLRLELPNQPHPALWRKKRVRKSRCRPPDKSCLWWRPSITETESKALSRLRGAQLRKIG